MAIRSIAYNVGAFPTVQNRVQVHNCDLRDWQGIVQATGFRYFDLITGTPPYFSPVTEQSQPNCPESLGCLFETKGSIVDYCLSASQLLRPPLVEGCVNMDKPSLFVVVHSSLHADATYLAAHDAGLMVIERTDVIPRAGKPPLFTVFAMVLKAWIGHSSLEQLETASQSSSSSSTLSPDLTREQLKQRLQADIFTASSSSPNTKGTGRVAGSMYGEVCKALLVREADGSSHSPEYAALLADLNKPSSFDREAR